MKCPVCSTEVKAKEKLCALCGFDDIRYEFLNDEELRMWQAYVVKPCKYAYRLNNSLKNEVETLRKEVKRLSDGNSVTQGINKNSDPLVPVKINMLDGWNYDDPIAHPKSATGSSSINITFSVSDIKSQMTSNSTATITFLVKKESDKKGNSSTDSFWVRYRVKDKSGVILLNETYYVQGLQVGDVTKGTIKLNGVAAGKHTIDFVSYS